MVGKCQMRLQPPKNIKKYLGKPATIKNIMSYIGNHRLIVSGEEKTLDEYFKTQEELNENDIPTLLGMFPFELEDLARIYLEEKLIVNQSNTQ